MPSSAPALLPYLCPLRVSPPGKENVVLEATCSQPLSSLQKMFQAICPTYYDARGKPASRSHVEVLRLQGRLVSPNVLLWYHLHEEYGQLQILLIVHSLMF